MSFILLHTCFNNTSFLSNKYFRSYTQDARRNADLQVKLLLFLSDMNQRCNEFRHLKNPPDISGSRLETWGQILRTWQSLFLSFLYRASFQHMEWKPTDVTILFVYCWIFTCFGPTGPSSGEFVQLFTQPLVQYLCRAVRVHANSAAHKLNQWLCEQLYELSWRWACEPETCRDPAIYE